MSIPIQYVKNLEDEVREQKLRIEELETLSKDLYTMAIWAVEMLPLHWREDRPMSIYALQQNYKKIMKGDKE